MKTGHFDAVLSSAGQPIAATITVFIRDSLTLATIYSNKDGSVQKDNPFQTDAYGRFQFFASPGYYDIQVSGTGITTYKIEDVFIGPAFQPADAVCSDGEIVTSDGEMVFDSNY